MKNLPQERKDELFKILKIRFEKNMNRHDGLLWSEVQTKLEAKPEKLWTINEMEETEGEPDVVGFSDGEYIFFDCSKETPKGRRSFCYDEEALESRKEHKPKNSAKGHAEEIGVELITEEEYYKLQSLGTFDTKTSTWLNTPADVRKLGGAIFGDYRFGRVFIYHNGAESYYGARAYRGKVRV